MIEKIKIAVVGGGCGALSAVLALTDPKTTGPRFEVTVYQMGWRLGGKGASGRNEAQHNRTEEHGLHVWMGFYENAFRWVRDCYKELPNAHSTSRFKTWDEAFLADPWVGVADESGGEWRTWSAYFPAVPGLPGDPLDPDTNPFTLTHYVERSVELLRALTQSVFFRNQRTPHDPHEIPVDFSHASPRQLVEKITNVLRTGVLSSVSAVYEAMAVLQVILSGRFSLPNGDYLILQYADAISANLKQQAQILVETDEALRPKLELIELVVTVVVGILRDRLLSDPQGLDAINDEDCRAWLLRHGASKRAVGSAFVRALYNVAFADQPDLEAPSPPLTAEHEAAKASAAAKAAEQDALLAFRKKPVAKKPEEKRGEMAAGQALRGALRFFFTYRGSLFWKLRASMGDAVFSPMYEVLKHRGVKFEFFHELVDVVPKYDGGRPHIAELRFRKQASVKPRRQLGKIHWANAAVEAGEYYPLKDGCWPSQPDYAQLEEGESLKAYDFESPHQGEAEEVCLHVSASRNAPGDFDFVILGVSLGALKYACPTLIKDDVRWQAMISNVKTVATQAMQLWTTEGLETLSALPDPITVAGFKPPFDTWSDMTHVIAEENWGAQSSTWPKGLAYFCGVLPDTSDPLPAQPKLPWLSPEEDAKARKRVVKWLDNSLPELWPGACDPTTGEFRWEVLNLERTAPATVDLDVSRKLALLKGHYLAFNVKPSDRYVLSRPDTFQYRISPLDNAYDNLTVAGDWTDCGFNEGCAEAAVMSGLLAAHSLSGSPALEDIIGYDHP